MQSLFWYHTAVLLIIFFYLTLICVRLLVPNFRICCPEQYILIISMQSIKAELRTLHSQNFRLVNIHIDGTELKCCWWIVMNCGKLRITICFTLFYFSYPFQAPPVPKANPDLALDFLRYCMQIELVMVFTCPEDFTTNFKHHLLLDCKIFTTHPAIYYSGKDGAVQYTIYSADSHWIS